MDHRQRYHNMSNNRSSHSGRRKRDDRSTISHRSRRLGQKRIVKPLALFVVESRPAPMTHVANATNCAAAWTALKRMYETIGTAAMTLLRNKFTSLRMNEGDDLEKHIQNARQILDELNVALVAEGATRINELEFIRQFLASLPESWSVLVSVIDQTPDATDADGVQLCQRILSRLLTEWH
ncbi:hypothetical protein OPQ81_001258 [Rhizoctonia solani]|nr:hypothetical protein OPQ81_001258 [Rhizoctonia solani]